MGQRPIRRAPLPHHRWSCTNPATCDEDQHRADECPECGALDSARAFFSRRRFTHRKARTALDESFWTMLERLRTGRRR